MMVNSQQNKSVNSSLVDSIRRNNETDGSEYAE